MTIKTPMRIYRKKKRKRKFKQSLELFLIYIFMFIGLLATLNWSINIFREYFNTKVIIINEVNRQIINDKSSAIKEVMHNKNDNLVSNLAEFTAYTARVEETDDSPFIMASGKRVYKGAIACPNKFKLGDKIKIDGLGIFICEDRMNKRYRDSEHFDIYFENYDEAIKFGRKQLSYKKL